MFLPAIDAADTRSALTGRVMQFFFLQSRRNLIPHTFCHKVHTQILTTSQLYGGIRVSAVREAKPVSQATQSTNLHPP